LSRALWEADSYSNSPFAKDTKITASTPRVPDSRAPIAPVRASPTLLLFIADYGYYAQYYNANPNNNRYGRDRPYDAKQVSKIGKAWKPERYIKS